MLTNFASIKLVQKLMKSVQVYFIQKHMYKALE